LSIDRTTCVLRPWRAGDEDSLSRYANNREIWLNLRDRFPHPYTQADAKAWIQAVAADEPPDHFAIEVESQPVGGIGLMLHNDVERVGAELGYWLGEPFWGRGIMTGAVGLITNYAFATFELTRVYALPYTRNKASMRVLEKAGFTLEGILRRNVIKDGVILDQAVYAFTDEDFKAAGHGFSLEERRGTSAESERPVTAFHYSADW
jgi:RimJ/RimL family protein N-acetyltransferase